MVRYPHSRRDVSVRAGVCAAAALLASMALTAAQTTSQRTFPTAREAAETLIDTVKRGNLDELLAIFGPDGQDLVASSDPATGRRNREVFTVAVSERWHLTDDTANRKTLVIGNEDWPFPVPIVKSGSRWKFDTAAGKEEVLDRRIGRNEGAAIDTCLAYVTAQRRYAQLGHDGKPAGLYASTFKSDPGKENGLYWPTSKGQKRSPLGDLVADAATEGRPIDANAGPRPFHGYYFRILAAQGAAAPGGAKSYVAGGAMSQGFALVAWPAEYNVTGVMTFIVNQEGVVREKDLGAGTHAAAAAMTLYNPDTSWHPVH
jgi:hypothetical protein